MQESSEGSQRIYFSLTGADGCLEMNLAVCVCVQVGYVGTSLRLSHVCINMIFVHLYRLEISVSQDLVSRLRECDLYASVQVKNGCQALSQVCVKVICMHPHRLELSV